jgi:DNA-binding PadR family transcriptional regulator
MEEDDILTASIEVVNGRARKYYSITEKGISILDEKLDELKIFMENMQNIIQLKPIL